MVMINSVIQNKLCNDITIFEHAVL